MERVKGKWTLGGSWLGKLTKYFHLHASFGCSVNTYTKEVFIALNLSSLGCVHLGSLFTRKVHEKAGSWLVCLQHVNFVMSLIQTVEHKTDFKLTIFNKLNKKSNEKLLSAFYSTATDRALWRFFFLVQFPFKKIPIRNPYSTAINRVSWFFIPVRFPFKKRTIRNPTLC